MSGTLTRWKAGGWHVHVKNDDGSWECHTWSGDIDGETDSLLFADSVYLKWDKQKYNRGKKNPRQEEFDNA